MTKEKNNLSSITSATYRQNPATPACPHSILEPEGTVLLVPFQLTNTSLTGKALACFNSLTHGAASTKLFVPDENPDEFFALLEDNFQQYQPTCDQNAGLVTDAVLARWFLLRRQRAYACFEATLHHNRPDPGDWCAQDLDRLTLFDRYKTQAERALQRALANVRHIRQDAIQEQHWQQLLAIRKERFELERQRFALAKEKAERLAKKIAKPRKPEPEVIFDEEHGSVVAQTFRVTVEDGVTRVEAYARDNNRIREIIDRRHLYVPPPRQVVRYYTFDNGVPPEYTWLIPASGDDTIYDAYACPLSFQEWRAVAAAEDAAHAIHAINHFELLKISEKVA